MHDLLLHVTKCTNFLALSPETPTRSTNRSAPATSKTRCCPWMPQCSGHWKQPALLEKRTHSEPGQERTRWACAISSCLNAAELPQVAGVMSEEGGHGDNKQNNGCKQTAQKLCFSIHGSVTVSPPKHVRVIFGDWQSISSLFWVLTERQSQARTLPFHVNHTLWWLCRRWEKTLFTEQPKLTAAERTTELGAQHLQSLTKVMSIRWPSWRKS